MHCTSNLVMTLLTEVCLEIYLIHQLFRLCLLQHDLDAKPLALDVCTELENLNSFCDINKLLTITV